MSMPQIKDTGWMIVIYLNLLLVFKPKFKEA